MKWLRELNQKFYLTEMFGLTNNSFICGYEGNSQFITQGQINTVINREISNKRKMKTLFENPMRGSYNFQAQFKKAG